jgi:hypothetical protein
MKPPRKSLNPILKEIAPACRYSGHRSGSLKACWPRQSSRWNTTEFSLTSVVSNRIESRPTPNGGA